MAAIKKQDTEDENPPVEKQKISTICVLQITRIGDLIQTYLASRKIKEEKSNIRLVLVARKQFAKPLEHLLTTVFDKIYYLDYRQLTREVTTLNELKGNTAEFVNEINQENIDVTVNLSFSRSSGFLNTLIKTKFRLGLSYTNQGQVSVPDKWSQYIYSVVMRGPFSSFSLVDIYKKILGSSIPDMTLARSTKGSKRIVCHAFASNPKKHWKPSKWTEIIYKLLKEDPSIEITLVGSKKEEEYTDEIYHHFLLKDYQNRINNLVGKTSIKELGELLQRSDLFIGHDSMVGHLAGVYNLTTLTIGLGTIRQHETTPYSAGNYVVTPTTKCFPCFPNDACEHYKCHSDVPYQVVIECIKQLRENGFISFAEVKKNCSSFVLQSVNIYESVFSEKSLFKLVDISDHEQPLNDIFRNLFRLSWLYFMEETEENMNFPRLTRESHSQLYDSLEGLKSLYELSNFGLHYSKAILEEFSSSTPNISQLKEHSAKLDEIEQLHTMLISRYVRLAPIAEFFLLERANLPGNNVVQIAENNYKSYYSENSIIKIVYELIEKTIAEYKQGSAVKESV